MECSAKRINRSVHKRQEAVNEDKGKLAEVPARYILSDRVMALPYRQLHSTIAPFIFLPLLSTALTGFFYIFSRRYLEFSKDDAAWLMKLHQFSYFPFSSVLYTTFLFLSVLPMIGTGYTMMSNTIRMPNSLRQMHNLVATIIVIFLCISAVTGWTYRFSRNVLDMKKADVKWLIGLHLLNLGGGSAVLYTLLLAISVFILVTTGLYMLPYVRQKLGKT